MMTKDELKPVMLAWLNEHPIQYRVRESLPWADWEPITALPDFNAYSFWRVKPEKKLRPWKPEEVPISGVIYRTKSWPDRWFLVKETYLSDGVRYIVLETSRGGLHTSDLFAVFEHSIDGGKTWHPCGVEE